MTPNNNLSCLPFYDNLEDQNARKWWVYGRVYPLYCDGALLPFQILTDISYNDYENNTHTITVQLYHNGGWVQYITEMAFVVINNNGYAQIQYIPGESMGQITNHGIGPWWLRLRVNVENVGSRYYYSEVFTLVSDMTPYLKIKWWDNETLVSDGGTIFYTGGYKNFLYLQADIAKPQYEFEDEEENRDGYSFPVKQISKKKYRFSFIASEFMLDVMRLIRLSDYIEITYAGKTYKPSSFLITPDWVDNGDVATVDAEFETDTVVKKLGKGYLMSSE